MFIPEIPDNQLFEKIKEIIEIAIDLEEETYFEFSDASTNDEINEWQQKNGIIIPDSAKEKPQEAEVIALGTGKTDKEGRTIAFQVKAGDRVLISKYGGTEVKFGDEKYTLLREDDILGIINK